MKARRNRMIICDFQGVVNGNLACEGTLRGHSNSRWIYYELNWIHVTRASRTVL